jgi:hypothetical protein
MIKQWLKHLARLYLPLYQYESDTMKIVYAGYSSIKKNYYVRLLLGSNCHHTFIGRKLFREIPGLINSGNFDIAVSEINRLNFNYFQNCPGYILPEFAKMRINIDRPMCEIMRHSVSDFSDVRRLIRKYNLTFETLTDKESFKYFNDKIYLPFISKRHGEEALIEDLNIIWKSSPSPFLMAIRENGKIVGGSLLRKSGDNLCLLRLGVLEGDEGYRRHGVIGALYYFGILEGQKTGCRYLDVGGTRPFLTDGLTKYKIGLGAEFFSDHYAWKEYLWLGVNEHSIGAQEFIRCNPFMHLNKDKVLTTYKLDRFI